MIKSLSIRNFQSHKATHLDFHSGVNVIVGESDSGKTAIIRALRLLVWNRPQGDSIRSNWGGRTKVEITTDIDTIARTKDTEEAYKLNTLTFKAFKTEVPEEIQQALNLTEINLQSQLDAPFLLSNSAGEVAAHFNRVAKLDKIDRGMQNINSWIKTLVSDIGYKQSSLSNAQKDLLAFEDLDKFEAEVEVLETMESRLTNKRANQAKLSGILNDLTQSDTNIQSYAGKLEIDGILNEILKAIEGKKELENKKEELHTLLEGIHYDIYNQKEYDKILSIEPDITKLLKLFEQKTKAEVEQSRLTRMLKTVADNDKAIRSAEVNFETLHEQFDKAFPDRCPLCNKPK